MTAGISLEELMARNQESANCLKIYVGRYHRRQAFDSFRKKNRSRLRMG
jgi:hypothetical protein